MHPHFSLYSWALSFDIVKFICLFLCEVLSSPPEEEENVFASKE